jgi:hypothetical protein
MFRFKSEGDRWLCVHGLHIAAAVYDAAASNSDYPEDLGHRFKRQAHDLRRIAQEMAAPFDALVL